MIRLQGPSMPVWKRPMQGQKQLRFRSHQRLTLAQDLISQLRLLYTTSIEVDSGFAASELYFPQSLIQDPGRDIDNSKAQQRTAKKRVKGRTSGYRRLVRFINIFCCIKCDEEDSLLRMRSGGNGFFLL